MAAHLTLHIFRTSSSTSLPSRSLEPILPPTLTLPTPVLSPSTYGSAFNSSPPSPSESFSPWKKYYFTLILNPFALVSGGYLKLYNFVEQYGKEGVQWGEKEFGLSPSDPIHSIIFVLGFNTFSGFSIFLPTLLATVVSNETGLQARLREEVRRVSGSSITSTRLSFESVKDMELVNSVVYETLRLNPPVALQYAQARKDFQLTSHDAVYNIKKGELLCGY